MKIDELDIKEKIGQTLIIGLDISKGKNMYEVIDKIVNEYKAGGICLYKKNYDSYNDLVNLINYIKEKSKKEKIPIFISVDQEGGRVNRMPSDFINIPSMYKLKCNSNNEKDLVKEAGNITGKMLRNLGFNMDFAPVLDIKRFPDNHSIGDRAISSNYEEVSKYGIEYMQELKKNNIVSVIKHFPGHGSTKKDSHFNLAKINVSMEELQKEDIIPFEKAINNGADAILIGHLILPKETLGLPVSLSKRFITKYIRKKYRYKGLIITDDLRMKAISLHFFGKRNPIKLAYVAGNDMMIIKYKGNEEKYIQNLINKIEESNLNIARLNRKVKRILNIKEKYDVNNEKIDIDENFRNNINNQIRKIKEKSLS